MLDLDDLNKFSLLLMKLPGSQMAFTNCPLGGFLSSELNFRGLLSSHFKIVLSILEDRHFSLFMQRWVFPIPHGYKLYKCPGLVNEACVFHK